MRVRGHTGRPASLAHGGARHLTAESRVAIYYAPEKDDPLWDAGCNWLGRDPEHDASVMQPKLDGIETVTAEARLYGFHCTLKPPMRLATQYSDLRGDIAALARAIRPFELPPLTVADLSGFLSLRESEPSLPLQSLADLCVAWPDRHRRTPSPNELQSRRGTGLPPDADELLVRWGYPHVFARWRFHMTLTGRLGPDDFSRWQAAAQRHFEAALTHPRRVESICLFTQRPGASFLLAERVPLG